MPCLLGLLALAFPRLVIVLVFLFSNYLQRAYDTLVWPLLGFLLMPLTTLAYAWAINAGGGLDGIYLVVFVLAVLVDLGIIGSGRCWRRRSGPA
ncbi:MAG: hypothetical protein ACK5AZ_12350 [Bryobacteraceae bacterium]